MTSTDDEDYTEYALPLIRRELIRVAARAEPYMDAREVRKFIIETVQTYDMDMLVDAAENRQLDFTLGVYRNRVSRSDT